MRNLLHLVLSIGITVGLAAPSLSKAEGVISYGGDQIIEDFFTYGWNTVSFLKSAQLPAEILPELTQKLTNTLKNVKVIVSTERLYINGTEVIAINDQFSNGSIQIRISQLRWIEFLKDATQIRRLVIHELLPLSGIRDTDYFYSNLIMKSLSCVLADHPSYCAMELALIYPEYLEAWAANSEEFYATSAYDFTLSSTLADHISYFRDPQIQSYIEKITASYFNPMNTNCPDPSAQSLLNLTGPSKLPFYKRINAIIRSWKKEVCHE